MTVSIFYSDLTSKISSKCVGPKLSKFLTMLCVISCIMLNGSVITGAIIEIGDILGAYFRVEAIIFKLAIIGIYFMLTIFIIEPEKLKPLAFFCSTAVILVSRLEFMSHFDDRQQCHRFDAEQYRSKRDSHLLRY